MIFLAYVHLGACFFFVFGETGDYSFLSSWFHTIVVIEAALLLGDVVLLPGGKAGRRAGEASSLESIWGLVGLEAREFALMGRARTEEV